MEDNTTHTGKKKKIFPFFSLYSLQSLSVFGVVYKRRREGGDGSGFRIRGGPQHLTCRPAPGVLLWVS